MPAADRVFKFDYGQHHLKLTLGDDAFRQAMSTNDKLTAMLGECSSYYHAWNGQGQFETPGFIAVADQSGKLSTLPGTLKINLSSEGLIFTRPDMDPECMYVPLAYVTGKYFENGQLTTDTNRALFPEELEQLKQDVTNGFKKSSGVELKEHRKTTYMVLVKK